MLRSYFSQNDLAKPENSFEKEYLLTSVTGAYSSSTLSCCNTRKYHGLLVAPVPEIDDENHVLLSGLDETIHYKGQSYKLATHQYPGTHYPTGNRLIEEFYATPVPAWLFQAGNAIISKEIVLSEKENILMIRYTLADADAPVKMHLLPQLAFRNVHALSKANLFLNKKTENIRNGIQLKLYAEYNPVFLQCSLNVSFVHKPDWYYNIEYQKEKERGYDYLEDLFSPGYFDFELNKGDQVIFSASLHELNPKSLKTRFRNEIKKKPVLSNMDQCLNQAAHEFIIGKKNKTYIKAGYHWFGTWGRDTFISLPGLTLSTGHPEIFRKVINSCIPDLKMGLFPNVGTSEKAVYNSADASLWFIWAIHQYTTYTNAWDDIWAMYGKEMHSILDHYKHGTLHNIKMDEDGLISQGDTGYALTWMDAVVKGQPVTPRNGKAVEINALWYNAICFCIEVAYLGGDKKFFNEWEDLPAKIKHSFTELFWDDEKQYLADCVSMVKSEQIKDWSVRPNQVFAVSLPFSPIPHEYRFAILEKIKTELLTTSGLRTLSPHDAQYKAHYAGDHESRDMAYHQGTVWPWLTGHFAEASLKESGVEAIALIEKLLNDFHPAFEEQCLYHIGEIYDGDEPHKPGGAISQAWSVAELIRINHLLSQEKKKQLIEIDAEQSGV
jgi:predicted glycogen debranching enzyme